MLVKTRLQINVVISVVTVFAIVLVLSLALNRVHRALDEATIASEIITSAFERSAFRSDYVRTDNERAKKQWFAKHKQMDGLLKSASETFSAAEDKKIIEAMIKDQLHSRKLFSGIVENRKKARPDADPASLSEETESRLATQMEMRLYDRVLNGRTLDQGAGRRLLSALMLAGGAIVCVIVIAAAAALLGSWTVCRTIADRIERLRAGAAVIGGGNLNYRIDTRGEDEFAELSRAFNAMTQKLHASYLKLENEIAERKSVEEELRQSEERFRTMADCHAAAGLDRPRRWVRLLV